MPDAKYITNLRTINLKTRMLVHTFCTHPPAIQQLKPSSGAKKIYSTKPKRILFHSSKIEWLNQQLLSGEKTVVQCFTGLSTKICFLGCFSIPEQIYFGMRWHSIFKTHFSVPVNFVILNHIVLCPHFKGHLEIY